MFQKVQQENEMLRSGRRPGSQGPIGGSGAHGQFNSLLSPPHNAHQQHNAPGSGRVVRITFIHVLYPYVRAGCAVLGLAVLCCAVLCCAVLCCAVLCCAVLGLAVLCCAVLCCAVCCILVKCIVAECC